PPATQLHFDRGTRRDHRPVGPDSLSLSVQPPAEATRGGGQRAPTLTTADGPDARRRRPPAGGDPGYAQSRQMLCPLRSYASCDWWCTRKHLAQVNSSAWRGSTRTLSSSLDRSTSSPAPRRAHV